MRLSPISPYLKLPPHPQIWILLYSIFLHRTFHHHMYYIFYWFIYLLSVSPPLAPQAPQVATHKKSHQPANQQQQQDPQVCTASCPGTQPCPPVVQHQHQTCKLEGTQPYTPGTYTSTEIPPDPNANCPGTSPLTSRPAATSWGRA